MVACAFAPLLILLTVSLAGATIPPFKSLKIGELRSPWFCHDLDCPTFKTIETVDADIELREYDAGVWVSTNISETSYDVAMNIGFMRLFAYISGANMNQQKIEMTAPVRAKFVPGDGPFCESHFKISFFLPLNLQDSPPLPTDKKVFIDPSPSMRLYVSSYPGFSTEEKVVLKVREVVQRLDNLKISFNASFFFSAGYDSPFRLLNRHNELWILAL